MGEETTPLTALSPGEEAVVRQLDGGRGFVGRLASLGLAPGARVKVLQNYGRGPLIVLVRDTRVALGRREAMRVWVSQEGGRGG